MRGSQRWAAALVFAVGLSTSSSIAIAREYEQAAAKEIPERALCLQGLDKPDPDARLPLAACTTVLTSGRAVPRDIALAYLSRAFAERRLGEAATAHADYARAAALLGTVIEPKQPEPLLLYRRATAWHALGDTERALADYDAALGGGLRRADAFLNRGLLLARAKGDLRKAMADFEQAATLEPENAYTVTLCAETHSLLGEHAAAQGDFDQALKMARAAGEPASSLADVEVRRGQAYVRGGDKAAARQAFDKALTLQADNVDALVERAALAALAGNHDAALDDLTRALKRQPGNAQALHNRGYSRFALGDFLGAIVDYSDALVAAPGMANAYANRCLARAAANYDLAAARADCTEALRRTPNAPNVHETMGFLYLKLGQARDAEAEYDRALALEPNRPVALWGRAIAKLRQGDREGGEADRRKAQARFGGIGLQFARYGIE